MDPSVNDNNQNNLENFEIKATENDDEPSSPTFFDPNNPKKEEKKELIPTISISQPGESNSMTANLLKVPEPKKYETFPSNEDREYGKKSHLEFTRKMQENKDPIGVMAKGGLRPITMSEIKQHNNSGSLWTVLNNKVYDLTMYLDYHPGGAKKLLLGAGRDCTSLFSKFCP